MSKSCPWYSMCIYKTATCRATLPDEGCVLYRWFRRLIKSEKSTDIFCPNCGITDPHPAFMQKYCRYCGHELKEKEDTE